MRQGLRATVWRDASQKEKRGQGRYGFAGLEPYLASGMLLNAAVAALTTLSLPILLQTKGFDKVAIAMFFASSAVGAALMNLTLGRASIRVESPRLHMALGGVLSGFGFLLVVYAREPLVVMVGGIAVMCITVNYPQYISLMKGASPTQRMSIVRMLSVIGYVVGTLVFSATSGLSLGTEPSPAQPAVTAALLCFTAALCCLFLRRPQEEQGRSVETEVTEKATDRTSTLASAAVVTSAILAIVLMRASDSLRGVYLPLYVSANGIPASSTGVLFATASLVEIAVLVPLAKTAQRRGSSPTLVGVACCGTLSFILVGLGHSYLALLLSQMVYGVFAAGFQSIGLTLLGEYLRGGVGAGAITYMAVVQLGSLVGIAAPLLVSGYSRANFAVAALLCAAAALSLTVLARHDRVVGRHAEG